MIHASTSLGEYSELRLRDEQACLARLLLELIEHVSAEEWEEACFLIDQLDYELERHMGYTEVLLFRAYARTSPAVTEWMGQLCLEHQALRRQLHVLVGNIHEHVPCLDGLDQFVEELDAHLEHVGSVLIPWLAGGSSKAIRREPSYALPLFN